MQKRCLLGLLLPCVTAAVGARAADPLGPGAGPWVVENPAAHGLDERLLDAAADNIWKIEDGAWSYRGLKNVTSRGCLVVIKDGALVYERYNTTGTNQHTPQPQPWSITSTQPGWSMTKTLGALLAGWAVTHGHLDLDKDITTGYGVRSPKSYRVTSRQIMSQSLAGDQSAGEGWSYDADGTGWINHMAQVVPAATGRNASQIWMEEFQGPLGLSKEFVWGGPSPLGGEDANPDSIWAYGSSGSCRDYARIMQLALNKGKWKGVSEPIVSADYIAQMTSPQTRYAPHKQYANPCYGFLTWLPGRGGQHGPSQKYPGTCLVPVNTSLSTQRQDWFPEGAPYDMYMAEGMGGQVAMVVPDANAVIVSMGQNSDPSHAAPVMYASLCRALLRGGACPQ
eukprot:SAG31_NODE_7194_length_1760_cov_1.067429_2_plen_394_part_01